MECAGVVVGVWVEWWSGFGWSGGRGLGGVVMVVDVESRGQGDGGETKIIKPWSRIFGFFGNAKSTSYF